MSSGGFFIELRQQRTLSVIFFGEKKSFGGLISVEMKLLGLSCRYRFYCGNLTEQLHYCFPPLSHIS